MGRSRSGSFRCKVGLHDWVVRADCNDRWRECGRCAKRKGQASPAAQLATGSEKPPERCTPWQG